MLPGHDGKFGFGGSCFPKDIQALINFGESSGVDMKVLRGTIGEELRGEDQNKIGKNLKGRRIVTDDK